MRHLVCSLAFVTALLGSGMVQAADVPVFNLAIKGHQFNPAVLEIPAGIKVKLIIDNQDSSAEEFESFELNREKVIPGNAKGTVFVGPLKPGEYPFFGEFNPKTAQGKIIVK